MARESRKSRTEKSPANEILLYKSTQLKDPYYVRVNKKESNGGQNSCKFSKSLWVKEINKQQSSHSQSKCIENSMRSSNCHYKQSRAYQKTTQNTYADSQSGQQYPKQRIDQLLGINSSGQSSKKTSIIISKDQSILREASKKDEQSLCQSEWETLKQQNYQLMRVNQLLLYQKQYFRQKMILQQVEIRDLTRKIEQLQEQKLSTSQTAKKHNKNKSQTQQSELTFKLRIDDQNINTSKFSQSGHQKQKKLINLVAYSTQKSSLLVSESEEDRTDQRIPLANKQNFGFGCSQSNIQLVKTEKQFSDLLESVQNQNNLNRKATLRKMLALKAMELKKVKQKP